MGALAALLVGGGLGFVLGWWACSDQYEQERDMTMAELQDYRAKASRVSVRTAKRETAGTMYRRLN